MKRASALMGSHVTDPLRIGAEDHQMTVRGIVNGKPITSSLSILLILSKLLSLMKRRTRMRRDLRKTGRQEIRLLRHPIRFIPLTSVHGFRPIVIR